MFAVSFIFTITFLSRATQSIARPVRGSIGRVSEDWNVYAGAIAQLLLILVVVVACACCRKQEKKDAMGAEKQVKGDGNAVAMTNSVRSPTSDKKDSEAKKVAEPAAPEPSPPEEVAKKKAVVAQASPTKKGSKVPKKHGTKKKGHTSPAGQIKSKSGSGEGSSDTLLGYPESPDEKKEMLSSSRKLEKSSTMASSTQPSVSVQPETT